MGTPLRKRRVEPAREVNAEPLRLRGLPGNGHGPHVDGPLVAQAPLELANDVTAEEVDVAPAQLRGPPASPVFPPLRRARRRHCR